MFGGGWTEMFIIGIVAFMVIGPKDLPVVMRKVGRMVATVRRMGAEFQAEISKTTGLDQITDLRRSLTEPLRQTTEEIAREFNRQTPSGVEPSGIMKPLDPKVESVYDQIKATSSAAATEIAPAAFVEPATPKPRRASKKAAEPAVIVAAPKPRKTSAPKAVTPTVAATPAPAKVYRAKPVVTKSAQAAVPASAKPTAKKPAPAKLAAAAAAPAAVTTPAPKAPAKPRTKKA